MNLTMEFAQEIDGRWIAEVPESSVAGPIRNLSQSLSTAAPSALLAAEPPITALASPLQSPAAASDLISVLKALPDCRMRWSNRYPQ